MSHLFLIGYRATGKTSVARLLAQRLNLPTDDVDSGIEALAGRRVSEIFAEDGEGRFRELETQVLEQLIQRSDRVISIGGGTVETPANLALLTRSGRCCWLRAKPETILHRIESDSESATLRPALTSLPMDEEIRIKLTDRTPLYAELAAKTVDVDALSLCEVADQIEDWWRGYLQEESSH